MAVIKLHIRSLVGFLISTFSLDQLLNWCWSNTLNSLAGLLPCLIGPLVSHTHQIAFITCELVYTGKLLHSIPLS